MPPADVRVCICPRGTHPGTGSPDDPLRYRGDSLSSRTYRSRNAHPREATEASPWTTRTSAWTPVGYQRHTRARMGNAGVGGMADDPDPSTLAAPDAYFTALRAVRVKPTQYG